jgi:hypothetical protein
MAARLARKLPLQRPDPFPRGALRLALYFEGPIRVDP